MCLNINKLPIIKFENKRYLHIVKINNIIVVYFRLIYDWLIIKYLINQSIKKYN